MGTLLWIWCIFWGITLIVMLLPESCIGWIAARIIVIILKIIAEEQI